MSDSESSIKRSDLAYPIYSRPPTLTERLALLLGFTLGFCPVCGQFARISDWGDNFRETGFCASCGSSNRKRQIAYVLCGSLSRWRGSKFRSIPKMLARMNLLIYNTEASGSLHSYLSQIPGYVCSEYLGSDHVSGEFVDGIRHEDLTKLSFPDNTLDVVVSSDVLEHVTLPYQAHHEIFRVLKPGGRHIFTAPFLQTMYNDQVFAEPTPNGGTKLLKTPIYHLDPRCPHGVLVYTYFSLDMVSKLGAIGFRTHMYRLYHPSLGILGNNGIVFEAMKPRHGLVQWSEDQKDLEQHDEEIANLRELVIKRANSKIQEI
jgi:SAM-dependent methyltransferase